MLIRPRSGDFHYSDGDFETIRRDAKWFLAHGADGIVVGLLTAEGRIDRARCAKLIEAATVIPMHYDTFPPIETDAEAFKADVESATSSKVQILQPGETFSA